MTRIWNLKPRYFIRKYRGFLPSLTRNTHPTYHLFIIPPLPNLWNVSQNSLPADHTCRFLQIHDLVTETSPSSRDRKISTWTTSRRDIAFFHGLSASGFIRTKCDTDGDTEGRWISHPALLNPGFVLVYFLKKPFQGGISGVPGGKRRAWWWWFTHPFRNVHGMLYIITIPEWKSWFLSTLC